MNKNTTITQDQFDELKPGDKIKNDHHSVTVEAKLGNILFLSGEKNDCFFCLLGELIQKKYYVVEKPKHYFGFVHANYEDTTVIVRLREKYFRLMSVSDKGFILEGYGVCKEEVSPIFSTKREIKINY